MRPHHVEIAYEEVLNTGGYLLSEQVHPGHMS